MKPTIDQVLKQGVTAHREGKLQEAEKLYRAILKSQPNHPDANHNLGTIAVGFGKIQEALAFFKLALESNPKHEQLWLSYIEALLKLGMLDDARQVLKRGGSIGLKGGKIDQLRLKLSDKFTPLGDMSYSGATLIQGIAEFYKHNQETLVSNATRGWQFALDFDCHYVQSGEKEKIKNLTSPGNTLNEFIREPFSKDELADKTDIIKTISQIPSLVDRYRKIKELIYTHHTMLTHNFPDHSNTASSLGQKLNAFTHENLNIVIIGGGITGLFLANVLKNCFHSKINIMVIDNRSHRSGIRETFDRNWLTYIPFQELQKHTATDIQSLIKCFSQGDMTSVPINVLESLLSISCRKLGVFFHFSPDIRNVDLDNDNISFYIDATGGRLKQSNILQANDINVSTSRISFPNFYGGLNVIKKNTASHENKNEYYLKAIGAYHFPYFKGTKIELKMMKLTGIPADSADRILKFISGNNGDNLFFLWKGNLHKSINEAMVFINLTKKTEKKFLTLLPRQANLKEFVKTHFSDISDLDKRILGIFTIIISEPACQKVVIERPFSYSPYFRFTDQIQTFNEKYIFPIGDSIFPGHPKLGNGLSFHLKFINMLVDIFIHYFDNSNNQQEAK